MKWNTQKRVSDPPGDDWLITYADAITLLMAFFVLMFSLSEIKQEKFAEFKSSIDAALGNKSALGMQTPKHAQQQTDEQTLFNGMADNIEGRLHSIAQRGDVRMARGQQGIYVDVYTDHFYEPGGFTIRPQMKQVLDDIVQELRPKFMTDYNVEIVGHTDDSPIRTPLMDSNWDLSATRAARIARYMIESGIEPRRVSAVGRADSDPVRENRNPDGTPNAENRAKNRRVQIRIEY